MNRHYLRTTKVWLLLATLSCAGTAPPPLAAPVDVHVASEPVLAPLDYMGDEFYSVVQVDVARLRTSPYFPRVLALVGEWAENEGSEATVDFQAGARLVEQTTSLVVGTAWLLPEGSTESTLESTFESTPESTPESTEPGSHLLFFLTGSYPLSDLYRFVHHRAEAAVMVEVLGRQGFSWGDMLALELSQGRYLMGGERTVRHVLQHPPRQPLTESASFVEASSRLGDGAVRWVAFGPLLPERSPLVEQVVSVTGEFDADLEVSLHGHLETHDVEGAMERLRSLPALMRMLGTLAGIDPDRIPTMEVREEEQAVVVSIELGPGEAEALLTYVEEHIAQQRDIRFPAP